MEKTDKTLSDAQLIERTIDFAGDLQKQVYDLQAALSDSQKHLADANRGAQRQSGVNQLLVKELVRVKNALSEKTKECEKLRMLLWLRHGCSALYGDDGEMQCSHCIIDFKRDSAESIEQKWYVAGYNKAEQALEGK